MIRIALLLLSLCVMVICGVFIVYTPAFVDAPRADLWAFYCFIISGFAAAFAAGWSRDMMRSPKNDGNRSMVGTRFDWEKWEWLDG